MLATLVESAQPRSRPARLREHVTCKGAAPGSGSVTGDINAGGGRSSDEIDRDANEEALVGLLLDDGQRTRVCATVDMIHQHAAGFNEAATYEIKKAQTRYSRLVRYFLKADARQ